MFNFINNIPNINIHLLKYIFEVMNLQHQPNTLWLDFSSSVNYISQFTNNNVYSFNRNIQQANDNVILIDEILENFIKIQDKKVSLIHIDCELCHYTKYILDTLKDYILDDCIIVFDELVNFPGFDEDNSELKILYEFINNNNIKFEWIGINGVPLGMHGSQHENVAIIIKHIPKL